MYEALTGVNIFQGNTAPETFANQFQLVPPPMSSVYPQGLFPPRLEQCVSKMLAKNPADRPQSVRQVMALLLSALGQSAPTSTAASA
jgi:serine/threonine protein kinase